MRYIQKGPEPAAFTDWKACENENWRPQYGFLRNPEKADVYNALLAEQGHICCYCERVLREQDYHIEHLNPQGSRAGDDLDYANLLCSCLDATKRGDPLHCGKKRGDRAIPIHPLQKDCQSKFIFKLSGEVGGIDKDSEDTIGILGLGIPKLTDMRKSALEPFLSDELNQDEIKSFVVSYVIPGADGKRNAFCSMIEYVFKEYLVDTD